MVILIAGIGLIIFFLFTLLANSRGIPDTASQRRFHGDGQGSDLREAKASVNALGSGNRRREQNNCGNEGGRRNWPKQLKIHIDTYTAIRLLDKDALNKYNPCMLSTHTGL